MARVDEIKVRLSADTGSFLKGMQEAQAALKRTGAAMRQAGEEIQSVGRGLTTAITAPLAAISTGALKLASDFESTFTQIETLTGTTTDEIEELRQGVLALAPALGQTPQELAEGLFAITSAGAKGSEALSILEASAKASAAGLGETSTIARAVVAAVAAYGEETLSASTATDILVATVREGNVEADELAGTLGRVVGIAAQVGVTFDQVGAFLATFTRLGVDANEAVTALRGILSTVIKPSKQAVDALAEIGLTTEDLRNKIREQGLAQALIELVDGFRGNEEALAAVIPNVRALAGVLGTAGVQAEAFTQIQENIRKSLGLTDEAFRKTKETVAFQFQALRAEVEVIGVELGQALIPAARELIASAKPLTAAIRGIVEDFRALSPEAKTSAIKMAALAAAVGPALVVFGGLVKVLGSTITLVGRLAGAVVFLTKGFAALFTVLNAKIAIVVATGAALASIQRSLSENFKILAANVDQFGLAIKGGVINALAFLAEKLEDVLGRIPVIGPKLAGAFSGLADSLRTESAEIQAEFNALESEASRSLVGLPEAFRLTMSDAASVVTEGMATVTSAFQVGTAEAGELAGESLVGSLAGAASTAVDTIGQEFARAKESGELDLKFPAKIEKPEDFEKKKDELAVGRAVTFKAEADTANAEQKFGALTAAEAKEIVAKPEVADALEQLKQLSLPEGKSIVAVVDEGDATAKFAQITRDDIKRIEALVDGEKAKEEIRTIIAPDGKRIRIDLDTAAALEQIGVFTKPETKALQLQLDLTGVDSTLAELDTRLAADKKSVALTADLEGFQSSVDTIPDPAGERQIRLFSNTEGLLESIASGVPDPIAERSVRMTLVPSPDEINTTLANAITSIPPATITADTAPAAGQVNAFVASIPEPIAVRTLKVNVVASGSPEAPFSAYFGRGGHAEQAVTGFTRTMSGKKVNLRIGLDTPDLNPFSKALDGMRDRLLKAGHVGQAAFDALESASKAFASGNIEDLKDVAANVRDFVAANTAFFNAQNQSMFNNTSIGAAEITQAFQFASVILRNFAGTADQAMRTIISGASAAASSVSNLGGAFSNAASAASSMSTAVEESTSGGVVLRVWGSGSPTLPISQYFDRYLPKKIDDSLGKISRRSSLIVPTEVLEPSALRIGSTVSAQTARRQDEVSADLKLAREAMESAVELLERNNALTGAGARETRDVRETLRGVPFAGHVSTLNDQALRRTTGRREII